MDAFSYEYDPTKTNQGSYFEIGNALLNFMYFRGAEIKVIERNRFTYINALSLAGGFYVIVNLFFLILSGMIQSSIYYKEIMKRLFLVEISSDEKRRKQYKKKIKKDIVDFDLGNSGSPDKKSS